MFWIRAWCVYLIFVRVYTRPTWLLHALYTFVRTYMPFCLQLLAPACPQHVLPLAGCRSRVQSDHGRPAAGTEELGRYRVQKGVRHAKFQSPAQAVRAANVRRARNRSRKHQHAAQVHNKRCVRRPRLDTEVKETGKH